MYLQEFLEKSVAELKRSIEHTEKKRAEHQAAADRSMAANLENNKGINEVDKALCQFDTTKYSVVALALSQEKYWLEREARQNREEAAHQQDKADSYQEKLTYAKTNLEEVMAVLAEIKVEEN